MQFSGFGFLRPVVGIKAVFLGNHGFVVRLQPGNGWQLRKALFPEMPYRRFVECEVGSVLLPVLLRLLRLFQPLIDGLGLSVNGGLPHEFLVGGNLAFQFFQLLPGGVLPRNGGGKGGFHFFGLDNVVITPGTLLLDCPVNAWITWKNRHSFQWRKILPLLAANFCGVIPGTLLLRFSMPWVIKTVLGLVVVLLGLEMATRSLRPVKPDRKDRPWLRLAVSAFSGVCAGLFGINMFIVAYLQRTARDYSEFKGSMCFLFFGENAVRVVTYLVTDLFTGPVLPFALASVPAAVLAMGLAAWLGPRLEEEKLQKGAIVLFLLGGVSIIVKSVVFHT